MSECEWVGVGQPVGGGFAAMWSMPFCHQWILRIFSCFVKLFVNHNGGTVNISSYFHGQEVIRQWVLCLILIPHKTLRFLKDLCHSLEMYPFISSS